MTLLDPHPFCSPTPVAAPPHACAGSPPSLLFSRVLQLHAASPVASAELAARWRRVPLRSYLPWAPQMLSLVGAGEGNHALVPLLAALGGEFPQQVRNSISQ